jgi:hypothetical protein
MRLLQALAMCYCEFDCDNICECDYVVGYIYIYIYIYVVGVHGLVCIGTNGPTKPSRW